MLKIQMKNYDEFREIFGTRCSSRGCIQNKVLLAFWKYRFPIDGDGRATQIKNMQDLFNLVINSLNNRACHSGYIVSINVGNLHYNFITKHLSTARTCIDYSNPKNIKYFDHSHQGKEYSMGAGRFFRTVLADSGARLNESTITYCSEEFQRLWETEVKKMISGYVLHVDQHFDRIYSSSYLAGNFNSCMVNKGQHYFYSNSVKASAAYLTHESNNLIYARCIIYHDVQDAEGNFHNYADRQYSLDGDEVLKTILVQKLIDAGIIDIYKVIGAGCREITAIVDKNGNRLKNPYLKTKCVLRYGDTKSFLDTFKYLYVIKGMLSNTCTSSLGPVMEMDHTPGRYTGGNTPAITIDRSNLPLI